MRFWEHVEELRKTALSMGLVILIASLLAFFFHKPLIELLLAPLEKPRFKREILVKERIFAYENMTLSLPEGPLHLKKGESLIIEVPQKGFFLFSPIEGFVAVMKLSLLAGLLLSSPLWLLFLLKFILPALGGGQRKILLPFFGLSLLFIGSGILFCYTVTLPLVGAFFQHFNESLGQNMWGLRETLDFTLALIISHGLVFELYVALLLLIHFGLLHASQLRRARRGVIVLILILAAILTPPDVLSQVLLALPMLALYEATILYGILGFKKKHLY